jgi:hypothetical protein
MLAEEENMQENWKRAHKTIPVAMILLIILAASMFLYTGLAPVSAKSGAVIDVFTQKTPSGKGINQSSDGFEPQELVVLYANVTYNEDPVVNENVGFQVNDPTGATVLNRGMATGANGIATVSFRLPTNVTFGTWIAIAKVEVSSEKVQDTLTFRVGWMIRITNIATLDAELKPQTRFLRQDVIVFNITVENIALTNKSSTITIDVQDAARYPIIHSELTNLVFPPGKNYVISSSQVPITATIGLATVSAGAYTAPPESGGILYSPAIASTFDIITRDIAVTAVIPSKTIVQRGEVDEITVKVKNKGNETESFNVTVYYDSVSIGKQYVSNLAPSNETQILFEWNTSDVLPGNYRITAVAGPVKGEIEIYDNTYVDGAVAIMPYFSLFALQWWIFLLMFMLAVVASLVLLLLLFYLRRRRRKKPPQRVYTVIVHPHI